MPIVVLCDGASRRNGMPGVASEGSIGVVIKRNDEIVGEFARGVGPRNNNECEYEAVLHAILFCWTAASAGVEEFRDPIICSDSLLVVNQVNKRWRYPRAPNLQTLLLSIWEIQKVFRFRLMKVPREEVAEADLLANLFLDQLERHQPGAPPSRE